ncbi:MAG: PucR family transcriptional regulator ligand-binding domain-containing protein [Actinomycetota bacterium]|nr:PucR family transcriptional regulator ligand-binding domain-containing protein [Actinomycetota bacterium]
MPVTVKDLLEVPSLDLRLVAGEAGIERSIRWAHTSELTDPTEWLSGGEFLLTTGMGLQGSAPHQRAYLQRLVDADLAGLGLGLGFGFERVPLPIVEMADEVGFAVVEVPYPTPFIAITEVVSSRLGEDRLRDAQMSVEVHERLTSMVTAGAGPSEVLEQVVQLAPGWAFLFDARGAVTAEAVAKGAHLPDAAEVWAGLPKNILARRGPATAGQAGPRGTSVALAVSTGGGHRPEGVLVFGKQARIEQRDRIVIHHAVTVLGLLLSSRRAVIETERRVAGDVLSEAFEGRLEGKELARRLELVGFGSDARLSVLVIEQERSEGQVDDLAWAVDAATGARAPTARVGIAGGRVAAVVDHPDPGALAKAVIAEVRETLGEEGNGATGLRIGVGESVDPERIRDSYVAALFALRAAPEMKSIALPSDLGSYGFLLGAQPPGVLDGFVRSVLGPLIDRDKSKSSHLVESVRAFIEAGGRWEQGAEALGVHRHTLRYRVRQAEELLDRNLSEAEDRLEVWLALKAAEILAE